MKSRLRRIETVHILEALWISAILIIPTACVSRNFIVSELDNSFTHVPKIALLRTIAASMLIISLYQMRNIQISWHLPTTPRNVLKRLKYSHQTLVFTAVVLTAISTIITTALSTNLSVSIWGLVPGLSGYSAYTSICYWIVFFVIATNLRSLDQLRRLLISIICMGVIVSSIGFFQHFGINIFLVLADNDYSRATLTTGNALFAGSLLLMPILITIGFSSAHLYTLAITHGVNKKFVISILLWSVILSGLLSAQLFTLSRAPIGATLSAIILLIVSLLIFRRFRLAAIMTSTIMISAMIALCINYIPVEYVANEPNNPASLNHITDYQYSSRAGERISDIKTQVVSGGLNQRIDIWASAAELIKTRPWFDSMDLTFQTIRPLIGYGPGTFKYVFNITSATGITGQPIEASHAHNYFIHQTVTEGVLGLISSVGLLASPIVMSGLLLIFRKDNTDLQILCLASIFALFSGRLAEQLLGLATTSDLTVFWACLAASITAVKIFPRNTLSANLCGHNEDKIFKTTERQSLRVFIIVLAALSILVFTIPHAIKYPVSGVFAGQSKSSFEAGDLEESLSRINTAIRMTPNVQHYYYLKNRILKEFLNHPEKALHRNCDKQVNDIIDNDNQGYSLCLAQEMYSTAIISSQIQPLSYQSVYQVAIISKMFGQDEESLRAYETLAELLPTNRTMLHMLSKEYISREMFKAAEDTLKQSLNIGEVNSNAQSDDFLTNEATELLNQIK